MRRSRWSAADCLRASTVSRHRPLWRPTRLSGMRTATCCPHHLRTTAGWLSSKRVTRFIHHIDLGFEPIRLALFTRLKQDIYVPAIKAEIAAVDQTPALAEQLDATAFKGLPTYGSYVARTTFLHTLAFNDHLRGLTNEELRYAVVSPGTDVAFPVVEHPVARRHPRQTRQGHGRQHRAGANGREQQRVGGGAATRRGRPDRPGHTGPAVWHRRRATAPGLGLVHTGGQRQPV